ncbi:hypothetical protein [Parvularcula sp. IMCC14364]|uniref:hypothetical protein n=1 Tax=Parvularcula sp. IMCC14364 TaxID=3067902 RepID=UPI002740FE9B|nr:hypothetical protein [Parvularcula sp. IMCC14364]
MLTGSTINLTRLLVLAAGVISLVGLSPAYAAGDKEKPQKVTYVTAPNAPKSQTLEMVRAKSDGCMSCHLETDEPSMHATPGINLGCTDCHGGDATVFLPEDVEWPAHLTKANISHGGEHAGGHDKDEYGDGAGHHDDGHAGSGHDGKEHGGSKKDGDYFAPKNDFEKYRNAAHVLPTYPESWHWPSAANPERSYTLLNKEAPEYIRFVNPSDYRVAREACGACHIEIIQAAERSLMATGAMLWGGAAYNNGILPFKNYVIGEAYTRDGTAAGLCSPGVERTEPNAILDLMGCDKIPPENALARGALPALGTLPTWQVVPPADVFRVFERGGRNVITQFAEVGLPNSLGLIQRLEEPGRPDLRQSNRGPGTGLRVAIPVLNIHKTRLNDPFTWFFGTNEQQGDYRSSGCASCHVVYANDREIRHSMVYAQYGRDGTSVTKDPTIPHDVSGHPLRHEFTRAIPTSLCMNCHMHQPNMFLNTYYGYTMWDYESDAPFMWPEEQRYPTIAEQREILDRNPEGAAVRGKWSDPEFLRNVYDLNPQLKDTQFADYHGHGWNFRAIFKRDRYGNLLDAEGNIVENDDPEKWRKGDEPKFVPPGTNPGKAVHMMSIHAEVGMQCADCHFAQDSHGNGYIHGEVANAVEIRCRDCHGTADAYPTLRTSNVAARPGGTDLSALRNPDGRRRFEWVTRDGQRALIQRSIIDPSVEWEMSLVKDSVNRDHPDFNDKSARAKLVTDTRNANGDFLWGPGATKAERAHDDDDMACYTCHLSWTTSCGGCHLPIEANWKVEENKFEGTTTRNYATYNPQVARDQMFQLGKHQTTKDNIVAPVRSTSALVLSSTNVNRERIYVQQPPIAASGYSSQAFAPHFPHTVRLTETKTCTDCHVSEENDNNAIMAQLLLLGTNFVNFVGLHTWVGTADAYEAIRVTEWDEPQAVFGSYLHRYAYPDYFEKHVEQNDRELVNWIRGRIFDLDNKGSGETGALEEIANVRQDTQGAVNCLQHRGEYLFVAEGKGGFRVYDIASIGNKGFSERSITAPFSPLGHDTHVKTNNATCMALPTTQPIAPERNVGDLMRVDNQEQPFHPIYNYAVVVDSEEGLILVDVNTMADGDPLNNFLERQLTWNEGAILSGARHITLAGYIAYITTDAGLAIIDLDDPLQPVHKGTIPLDDARATAVQFRYLWVTTANGLELMDITTLDAPVHIPSATVPFADAHKVYLARTYAYVAAGSEGLVIVDIEKAEEPEIFQQVTLDGKLSDARDVMVATTNASLFAYVADGVNGFKLLQLTSPTLQPNFYGFSPAPNPELIAWKRTKSAALALSKGLDRDRAVDETGHQMAVFGRLGSRPFTRTEMEDLFLDDDGEIFTVNDTPDMGSYLPE